MREEIVGEMGLPRSYALRSNKVFTMNTARDVVDGYVLVDDGHITAVERGTNVPADYPVIDVGSRVLLPGFVDPHVHLEMTATATWQTVDCHTPPCSSIEELLQQLHDHRELRHSRGGWLVGQGGLFADRRFSEGRLPNRDDLDRVSTEFPIAVRFGAHVTVLNSAGLAQTDVQALQIGDDAHIEFRGDGQPTGVVHEMFHLLPIPKQSPEDLRTAMVATAERHLTRYGVTAIGEITNTLSGMEVMCEETASGRVPQSVRAFVWAPGTAGLDDIWSAAAANVLPAADRYDVAGLKIFVDGGFSAAGAAVLRPYRNNPLSTGRMAYGFDELVQLIRDADQHGLQVAAHVNGERAQRELCQAAIEARGSESDERPQLRLEHAGNVVTNLETVEYWQSAGAAIVAQAGFVWTMGTFLEDYLGDYAANARFPFSTLHRLGLAVASSSDGAGSEMLQFNPMFGVQCAVARLSCVGDVIVPNEAVGVMEALAMHTINAAQALGVSPERGSLETGKVADIVVLPEDPREVDATELAALIPQYVVIDGRLVHPADTLPHGDLRSSLR